ncbi:response regulator transcription factor [Permianibacter sp. IMCC34836]|uniref:response regulator n=1 Tax=Permianibacter fluminis TaxID=2738515 RepID=UPI00155753AE|nr:response regulator transcription factor [Permianibacter fluminis]NQD38854.1 response regulator transcription factor [Permianibacter fluminis]
MSRLCLVLVEDHPLLRQTAIEILQTAFPAADIRDFVYAEAAEAFCQNQPVDVVITDLALPGMSGMALLESLRRHHPQLPVIIQTLYDSAEHRRLADLLNAFRLLNKGEMAQQLVSTVRAALAHTGRLDAADQNS